MSLLRSETVLVIHTIYKRNGQLSHPNYSAETIRGEMTLDYDEVLFAGNSIALVNVGLLMDFTTSHTYLSQLRGILCIASAQISHGTTAP